jgi:hypothetical protein
MSSRRTKAASARSFARIALRHIRNTDDPIRREIFWDALSGQDRYDCDEYTDEDKAREYFLGQYSELGGKL